MTQLEILANKLNVKCETDEDLITACIKQLEKIPYIPFPVSLHTVDVLIQRIKKENGKVEVLLGRKKNQDKFQIIGGFVDAGESAEVSALRELNEETSIKLPLTTTSSLVNSYRGSFFINDPRFKDSCHKISSSFYTLTVDESYVPIAADDIEEVKWFMFTDLRRFYKDIVREIHWELIEDYYKL